MIAGRTNQMARSDVIGGTSQSGQASELAPPPLFAQEAIEGRIAASGRATAFPCLRLIGSRQRGRVGFRLGAHL